MGIISCETPLLLLAEDEALTALDTAADDADDPETTPVGAEDEPAGPLDV